MGFLLCSQILRLPVFSNSVRFVFVVKFCNMSEEYVQGKDKVYEYVILHLWTKHGVGGVERWHVDGFYHAAEMQTEKMTYLAGKLSTPESPCFVHPRFVLHEVVQDKLYYVGSKERHMMKSSF